MKNVQANIALALIVIFSVPGTAQSLNSVTAIKKEIPKRECEFSLFVGSSFFGPVNDFKEAINAESFTTTSANPYSVSQDLSFRTSPSYFFEFKYNLNQQSGISISRGTMDAFSISHNGYGPKVKGGFKSTSINYEHSLGRSRHEFSTGISFLSIRMKSTDNDDVVSGKDITKKVGLNLGYAYHIIESNGFFLAFHAQYNWAGSAEVGPYSVYEPGYDYDYIFWQGHVDSRNTQYPAVRVNLDSFNIGFSVGFRFGDVIAEPVAQHGDNKF